MSVLSQLISRIPGLDDYNEQVKQNNAQSVQGLQQASGLMGLVTNMRAQDKARRDEQEVLQLSDVVRQAGGDPRRAIKDLLSTGTPQGIAMADKIRGILKYQQGQQIGTGLLNPDGTITSPPKIPQQSDLSRLISERNALPPEHPDRTVYESALTKKTETPERFSNLQRLLSENAALPAGHPDKPAYANAIRKESETAKQISPTIVLPRQESPVQTYVDGEGNLLERERGGSWRPAVMASGEAAPKQRPQSGISGANSNAMRLRNDYDKNPEVKLANSLEPKVGPMADYVATIGRGRGNSVGDAELVKLWLMTTHPKGDQISNLDHRQISQMPDLWGRVKNVAGNFAFGKTLDSDTRRDMWKSVSEKYKETDSMRQKQKSDVLLRGAAMKLDSESIFPTVKQE